MKFKCPICLRAFKSLAGLKTHFLHRHAQCRKTCPICGFTGNVLQHSSAMTQHFEDQTHQILYWLLSKSRSKNRVKRETAYKVTLKTVNKTIFARRTPTYA